MYCGRIFVLLGSLGSCVANAHTEVLPQQHMLSLSRNFAWKAQYVSHTAPVDVLCGQHVLHMCLPDVLISQYILNTRGDVVLTFQYMLKISFSGRRIGIDRAAGLVGSPMTLKSPIHVVTST